MSASTPNTILLDINGGERPVYNHRKAAVANILPGHFIVPSGAVSVALPTAAQVTTRLVAVEASWAAAVNTPAIDQAYPNGDTVSYIQAQAGDLIYAILAASQVAVIGSVLDVTTAGTLAVEATNTGHDVVAVAEEAVTTTGATARIRVRIL